jgi:hypothetical protein
MMMMMMMMIMMMMMMMMMMKYLLYAIGFQHSFRFSFSKVDFGVK